MFLAEQCKQSTGKKRPDADKVAKLVEITFCARRHLLKNGILIKDLVQQYPCLMLKIEVWVYFFSKHSLLHDTDFFD